MSIKKDKSMGKELSYGPNKKSLFLGVAIFLVGLFILFQIILVVIVTILDPEFSITDAIQIMLNDPITIITGALLLSIGVWLSASGAEAIIITDSYLEHKKLFSKTLHYWKDTNDEFNLLIRSSQPTMKGRKGIEAWQVEIHITDRKIENKSKISIPSINNEKEVVLFIRNLRRIVNAEPVGHREINEKLITGKNQKISFKINHTSVKELSKRKRR